MEIQRFRDMETGDAFYLVNKSGVQTLCRMNRGKLHSHDTVHIVGGFVGGDTGMTKQQYLEDGFCIVRVSELNEKH